MERSRSRLLARTSAAREAATASPRSWLQARLSPRSWSRVHAVGVRSLSLAGCLVSRGFSSSLRRVPASRWSCCRISGRTPGRWRSTPSPWSPSTRRPAPAPRPPPCRARPSSGASPRRPRPRSAWRLGLVAWTPGWRLKEDGTIGFGIHRLPGILRTERQPENRPGKASPDSKRPRLHANISGALGSRGGVSTHFNEFDL
mmetsp:Transcript_75746/g.197121  ORF Transcript_75746/g.197121 Transcript_75746/m.197121 type:complete len:201 (-) Transcript_75746:47-649(-)